MYVAQWTLLGSVSRDRSRGLVCLCLFVFVTMNAQKCVLLFAGQASCCSGVDVGLAITLVGFMVISSLMICYFHNYGCQHPRSDDGKKSDEKSSLPKKKKKRVSIDKKQQPPAIKKKKRRALSDGQDLPPAIKKKKMAVPVQKQGRPRVIKKGTKRARAGKQVLVQDITVMDLETPTDMNTI